MIITLPICISEIVIRFVIVIFSFYLPNNPVKVTLLLTHIRNEETELEFRPTSASPVYGTPLKI